MNEWISIKNKDRLPPERTVVLIYTSEGIMTGFIETLFLVPRWESFPTREHCEEPTHWMPLPKPPDLS